MLNAEDAAWVAGLFEGEGTIYIRPERIELEVKMCDRDVVERLRDVVGCGSVTHKRDPRPRHADVWHWRTGEAWEVHELLRAIRPYLGNRRGAKADDALRQIDDARRARTARLQHGRKDGNQLRATFG